MKKLPLKWEIQPAPTGRYRSFYNRPWPIAVYPNGALCASISAKDDGEYVPSNVNTGNHAPSDYMWLTGAADIVSQSPLTLNMPH